MLGDSDWIAGRDEDVGRGGGSVRGLRGWAGGCSWSRGPWCGTEGLLHRPDAAAGAQERGAVGGGDGAASGVGAASVADALRQRLAVVGSGAVAKVRGVGV